MNKKGFLLAEETLKIIIAVVCISFLAYLLFSVYMKNKTGEKLEFAKASLDYLVKEMSARNPEVVIYNPEGWSLSSWPYENQRPDSCINLGWEACICICEEPIINSNKNYLDNCNAESVCFNNPENFKVMFNGNSQNPIDIENPPIKLTIDYNSKIIK